MTIALRTGSFKNGRPTNFLGLIASLLETILFLTSKLCFSSIHPKHYWRISYMSSGPNYLRNLSTPGPTKLKFILCTENGKVDLADMTATNFKCELQVSCFLHMGKFWWWFFLQGRDAWKQVIN